MAVAFDNSGQVNGGTSSVNSLTSAAFTMGSGTNRVAIVILSFNTTTTPAGLAVNWNTNEAFTAITSAVVHDANTGYTVIAYGRVNPTSGSHTFTASWTTALTGALMGFASFSGADQTGGATTFPHGTSATGNNAAPSITITTANGNATVAGFCDDGGTNFSSITGNGTQAWLANTASAPGGNHAGSYHLSTAGSNVQSGVIAASDFWAGVGFDILAASAADVLRSQIWL